MAAHISSLFLLAIIVSISTSQASTNFTFNGFNQSSLLLDGGAKVLNNPNGALKLTNKSNHVIGHAFYPNPIQFAPPFSPNASSSSSFSTHFVLAIVSLGATRGGYGLAFTISPNPNFPGAETGHFLGILNSTNDGNSTNHLFAVEFDIVKGFEETTDSFGNHIGINVNSMSSVATMPAAYYGSDEHNSNEVNLENDGPIQAWIDYDGIGKLVNVTIAPLSLPRPTRPLLSRNVDLSPVLNEYMYVGFSAATGKKSSFHYILGWSFRLNGVADPLDLSKLPTVPNERNSSASTIETKVFLTIFILVFVFLVALFLAIMVYRRRMKFEGLEDWEKDCPHRFRYKDLYAATKGFKKSEIVGVGGFGEVFKGELPSDGSLVAIKKINANNNLQGMREFTAEIESLGRVRHKNLVNLQGWCKKKNDLLLIYDYIPNGSLYSRLFGNEYQLQVLSWENRFKIVKGIAQGLLYLHEEWEKVVIHRDVKSSNVLIDADMNGRLGDFGLARLYDHDKNSHTTSLVGTIGYIAPELARSGKASTSSDVFAYGVLLLEVASGRKPIFSDPPNGQVALVDWAIQRFQSGRILEAIDRKLGMSYEVGEVELVFGLGLLCTRSRAEARPSIRQVVRYLNGDEMVPIIDETVLSEARVMDERMSRFLEVINGADVGASRSYGSSSMAEMLSNGSLDAGR